MIEIDGNEAFLKTLIPKSGNPEISLYFHIPFCSRKCPYCHFYVIANRPLEQGVLFQAFKQEWQLRLPELKDKVVASIYFGGGTPSLFELHYLERLLDLIKQSSNISPSCEITIEGNPEDLHLSKLTAFKELGFNRLSIGVQSFDDTLLAFLKRTHHAKQAFSVIDHSKQAGFDNISIDLMYELPHHSLDSWQNTLSTVQGLPITHLSLYNLVIEPESAFFKQKKQISALMPSDDIGRQMLEMATEKLSSWRFNRYEISAFAKEGFFSKHNTGYWTARPFLGFGPSAFSYWKQKRHRNHANLKLYADSLEKGFLPIDFEESLPFPDNLHELFAVELRLMQGVDILSFEERHGKLPLASHKKLDELIFKGWLAKNNESIQLTHEGAFFYDSVATEII